MIDRIIKTDKIDWRKLIPFQPENLKKTTPERMAKLKRSLENNGYVSTFYIWERAKKLYCIDGHHRLIAMKEIEASGKKLPEKLPVVFLRIESDEQAKKLVLAFNSHYAEMQSSGVIDFIKGLNIDEIIGEMDIFKGSFNIIDAVNEEEINHGRLSEKFIIPPFSVIDLKSGLMLERAKRWRKYGIESQIGRADELTYQVKSIKKYKGMQTIKGTSTFNPALTEVIYEWFSKSNDTIIDPWAGGSVRGIVAASKKRKYYGIDISEKQIEENKKQADAVNVRPVEYIIGNSANPNSFKNIPNADLMIGCPPYGSLEVYSEDPEDLSNMPIGEFKKAYQATVNNCFSKLSENRFAVMVVADYREKGILQDFISQTIKAFTMSGFIYHSDGVILTPIGSAAIRADKIFTPSRKLVKTHQNLLVFVKGDAKKASERING